MSNALTILPLIDRVEVAVYRVPTDFPESDGTAKWDHTDVVVVQTHAGNAAGLGWTYAAAAAGAIVRDILSTHVVGKSSAAIESCWQTMARSVRNAGWPGVSATALSAVDISLWDLKAKLLGQSLPDLIGPVRDAIDIYGSGGFTSYDDRQLTDQLRGWVDAGISRVKMKVGRNPSDDPRRVAVARRAIGEDVQLFVDANGAYAAKEAIALSHRFSDESGVVWFEEPRSSDDLEGLRQVRNAAPPVIEIAAGEYGYTPDYFRKMLSANAVDVIQADATRCGGYTGFLKAAALAEAFHVPLSAHCGPQLHAPICCCTQPARHIEYFHDHVRIESMLFDGAIKPVGGQIAPQRQQPGHGMRLNKSNAAQFQIQS
jgi:L-alanine-DL-glutamate epimerase-like enolase superfamily enzyme